MEFNFQHCEVVRWVDGDTVDLKIDLGFKVTTEQRFRLAEVNTPEKKMPGYSDAIDFVNKQAPVGSNVDVVCHGHDRYGRWIATVSNKEGSINKKLLDSKLAVDYK